MNKQTAGRLDPIQKNRVEKIIRAGENETMELKDPAASCEESFHP
jgi:hypothetical protein